MSPEEYLKEAERFRKLKEAATNPVTMRHLAAMEQSYQTLAASEAQLRKGTEHD